MSLEGGLDTSAEAKARFEGEGFQVVFPQPNELQIDIDSEEQREKFLRLFEALNRNSGGLQFTVTKDTPSRSGLPKRHLTLSCSRDMDAVMRIALQASLGSDPMRELLSFCRHLQGDPNPSIFVEPGAPAAS